MKTLIIWACSLLIAGIIISPFFWLRFLKEKSKSKYIILSSAITVGLFMLYIYVGYDFINNWTAKVSADLYYMAYDFTDYALYLILLLIIIFPFIFTKIYFGRIRVKSFIISLLLSIVIFMMFFLYWAYVLLPVAFSKLHDYI